MSVALALVGAGRMGAVHGAAIRRSRDARLAMVVDVDATAAEAVARGGRTTADLDEALVGVDGLVVAAPTPTHPSIVERAIEAQVPVLCEKPLSFDPEESLRLQQLADDAGVVLGVGFWRRFSRPWAAARRLLTEGAIGRPVMIRLSQWDADPPPPAFCSREVSGGLFVDCGVHEFELIEHLLGASISTVTATSLPPVDPEIAAVGDVDNGLVTVSTDDGVVGIVDLSRNARYGDDVRTEILGSEGALFIDGLPGGRLRMGDRHGLRTVPGTEMIDLMWGGVTAQLEAFLAAVRGERPTLADGGSSARATAAGLAAWRSLDGGGSAESL